MEEVPQILNEQQSGVNPNFPFDKDYWVISVLNTKEREFIGHGVILVEGIKEGQLFVGRYDVMAERDYSFDDYEPDSSSIFRSVSKHAYITCVKMLEGASYDHRLFDLYLVSSTEDRTPSDIPYNAILLQKVQAQITAYWFEGSKVRKKILTVEEASGVNHLEFPPVDESRSWAKVEKPFIRQITSLCGYHLLDGTAFYATCASRSFQRPAADVEKMIQSIKEDKVKTEEAYLKKAGYLHYKYPDPENKNTHDLQTLFSKSASGFNCAEWCAEKLKIAGVDLTIAPAPVNEETEGGCLIL